MQCASCGNSFDGRTGFMVGNERYCPTCFRHDFITCAAHDCRGHVHVEEAIQGADGGYYCPSCYHRLFYCCDQCGTEHSRDQITHNRFGDYCPLCIDRCFITCHGCHETLRRYDSYVTYCGEYYCRDCYSDNFSTCHGCGNTHRRDELNDDGYCDECADNQPEWGMGNFVCDHPTYDRIGSTRKFGVELETANCREHRSIRGRTIWECKSDCSIEGKEFVSPVLYGDRGLDEVISFCGHAERLRWRVNRQCGYHAHFDMEGEDWVALRSIAYAYVLTQNLWMQLVSEDRSHNSYCGRVDYDEGEVLRIDSATDWDYFVGERDRFEFINWRAYLVHGSMEIRLHDASLNASAINNWVMIHARFIDYVKELNETELREKFAGDTDCQMEAMREIIGTELWEYYIEVAERNGNAFQINTVDINNPPF